MPHDRPEQVNVDATLAERWLAIDALMPGQILARPVVGHNHGRLTLMLAAGSALTAGSINQLTLNGVECVVVQEPNPPTAAEYQGIKDAYEARLREIFDCHEGKPRPPCQPLFDALLKIGPAI